MESSWVTGWCSWSLNITTCGVKTGMLSFTRGTFGPRAAAQLRQPVPIPGRAEQGLDPALWALYSRYLCRVLLIVHWCCGDLGLFFVLTFLGLSSCFSFLCVTDIEETVIFQVLASFFFSPPMKPVCSNTVLARPYFELMLKYTLLPCEDSQWGFAKQKLGKPQQAGFEWVK